ncbi:MAG: 2-isopropylmalate synthase [Sphingobacteriales bacterium 17-39-43]|uniref:alpha-isopropylmalate synthase regulatory domain-containing protein n=1 Tax=Daejeonella sp. TaxID=2805397 RepID=UPI000BD3D5AD|nr:alpha-isopropylmalate synthase regulatory domain-containing protein [Daejeonella sp.]OYY04585.1 MAG: 2-isopropylmalate synthase [Sphingobacteriia bacterium 35-40-5]OYZ29407.1 MAG: 2-isopropylmalate synthase [Sphingobacteriales bacterium 16-39-50]OZA22498.1 MAG: 2-isopropylmalate synthase [Sphingobacteriales bacterium 17-39-43]OZA59908.1 MAG: 2-isopropylmalate synthase [Sphingobacteriales bacterium 39-40-5]HQS50630.1 alpha-isopropylmalate synthase regulatory domain-containing protein [Daejeo
MGKKRIEIMDTTLRDGEQTSGVSFSISEKLTITQLLLEELRVDRVEVASARVSEGEFASVKAIMDWANTHGHTDQIEVLSFVDQGVSIDWMAKAGVKVQNLLTKGSLNHLKHQLKKTPEQHFAEIADIFTLAAKHGISSNVYLEDWSNGMRNSPEYVFQYLDFLAGQPVKRILLPDTLGVLTPSETFNYISQIKTRYPKLHFDFHAHNDYDLANANILEAIRAGADGLHLTVNGMGERAGNASMASAVAAINDFMPEVEININEEAIYTVSKLVETFSGIRIPSNKPIVGDNVFTQTAGIHADGDSKNNLYFNDLLPERFGRKRTYALGKTSGKANIEKNLQELGLKLSDQDLKKVTQRVIELGDMKETVTKEDLPYIISDVLNSPSTTDKVIVDSYVLTHSKGLRPSATISVRFDGELFEENAQGDGQFDAFMKALGKVYEKKKACLPKLIDYAVRIAPGSNSDALCETIITWETPTKKFITRGLDSDQTVCAIKATQKMLNII